MQASPSRKIVHGRVELVLVSMVQVHRIPRHRLQDHLHRHHRPHQLQHLGQRKAVAADHARVRRTVGREVPSSFVALITKCVWTEPLVEIGVQIAMPAKLVDLLQHHHHHRHQGLGKVAAEMHAQAQAIVQQACFAALTTICAWTKRPEELGALIATIAKQALLRLLRRHLHHQLLSDLVVRVVILRVRLNHIAAFGPRQKMISLIGPARVDEHQAVAPVPTRLKADRIIFSSKRHVLVDRATQRRWKPLSISRGQMHTWSLGITCTAAQWAS
mmetsp:Transcript_75810/g.119761  ORF Transcript_75810/g.119761 Transcript_75810/m.119761 type:complete len:273 (+) Transcript_75810:621-1439(+)